MRGRTTLPTTICGPGHLSAVPGPVLQPVVALSQLHDHRQTRGVDVPSAIWSSVPEPWGSPGPPAPLAYGCKCGTVPTRLWQYGEQGVCNFASSVDLDLGAPGFVTARFCFHLS